MKRLNCTYEFKSDNEYPWLLKHPKIKEGLAKFKTRSDALEWYMLLNFETAIWFQNEKRIFAGQLTIDSNKDKSKWFNYIKTAGFDGGATYSGICNELNIDPFTFKHDDSNAIERFDNLDFVLISDPETYFPEKLEVKKKAKSKDVVDVDQIKSKYQAQIDELMKQINQNSAEVDRDLEELKNALNQKEVDFEDLNAKIEQLKNANNTYEKLVHIEYKSLSSNDLVGAVAVYNDKLNEIIENLKNTTTTRKDFAKIEENIKNFDNDICQIKNKDSLKHKLVLDKLYEEFTFASKKLLNEIQIDESLDNGEDISATFMDSKNNEVKKIAFETSYVLVDLKFVTFVPKDKYNYEIPETGVRSRYSITVVNSDDQTKTTTISSDLHSEDKKPESSDINKQKIKSLPNKNVIHSAINMSDSEFDNMQSQKENEDLTKTMLIKRLTKKEEFEKAKDSNIRPLVQVFPGEDLELEVISKSRETEIALPGNLKDIKEEIVYKKVSSSNNDNKIDGDSNNVFKAIEAENNGLDEILELEEESEVEDPEEILSNYEFCELTPIKILSLEGDPKQIKEEIFYKKVTPYYKKSKLNNYAKNEEIGFVNTNEITDSNSIKVTKKRKSKQKEVGFSLLIVLLIILITAIVLLLLNHFHVISITNWIESIKKIFNK
ncbi:MAG3090 family protein [Mycoplasma sp. Mirounga ES2805-ORL]|uniref:MAG3090 family protein n=1 Tax=Mycoplasma sp. Mirounga ES2805-ORL TaxID=754514 RepID=UPI00197B1D18|nr:hypothetical protein [Mycoplasma sp. Mirounga ES2805-ORL]QSF13777.1 hypothetical protein JXZ90_00540 [Mycoplasma sp. Mirounga ES2805-ORL]